MLERKKRESSEINASSMADIAFLLLIFFLVTTTIASDKGINMFLPPFVEENVEIEINEDDVFTISINSADRLMVEKDFIELDQVKEEFLAFLDKHGDPTKAIVSIKADRGTTYKVYHKVLDQVKTGYFELRAESVDLTYDDYMRLLNNKNRTTKEEAMYETSKDLYPLRISEAEPSKIGG